MFEKLKLKIMGAYERLHVHLEKIYHRIHLVAHATYFGAVYFEGHGLYAATGGLLLILTIVGVLFHGD